MTSGDIAIAELFQRDPTRELEEVQKVNATERAENDIDEFYETPSVSAVLSELGELVTRHPHQNPRFLYVHATFGSGKTHLLKLIGFATGEMGPNADVLAAKLANQFGGFADFRSLLDESHVDHLIPVFLNLLDRDAAQEPPLPMMIYEAIGRELGFPTDPRWLLAWVWDLELDRAPGLWASIQSQTHNGQSFDDVLEERGAIRSWLCAVLPEIAEASEAGFSDAASVRESIQAAEQRVNPDIFGPDDLVTRVKEATEYLSEKRGGAAELLLGLDEVALFIGDSQDRYEEFQRTVQSLINGPNPVILGTGQWPPDAIHESFFTEAEPPTWFRNHVELRGADTEIIVRNRWLRKASEHGNRVSELLEENNLESIDFAERVDIPDPDPIESYPFRETDLWLLREVMQNLLGRGLPTEHEHIQGRALLVVVRALFTRRGWAEQSVGAIVSWDELFDLLAEDEALIPSWATDLIARIEATLGEQTPRVTETAKTMYLLNRANPVPATARNLARLLVDSVDADIGQVEDEVATSLAVLEMDNYVYDVDEVEGEPVYELLSQEEVTLQEKIGRREVSHPQLRARITEWLQDHPLLLAEDRRHEVDLANERKVPVRYAYSVLRGVQSPSTPPYDAVGVRILAGYADIEDEIDQWKQLNDDQGGEEDLLVVVDLSEGYLDRLRRMIATQDVLGSETQRYRELETSVREDERDLEERLNRNLREADVLDPSGETLGKFGEGFEEVVVERVVRADREPKFPKRKVLQKGLQEISDARSLTKFFNGDGPWPLERQDAEMLGVNTTTRELEDGWVTEFLEAHDDQAVVDGQTLLAQIQDRGGDYLGSPLESLAGLLLVLAGVPKIELKRDGRPLREPDEMGRAVRTVEDLRRLEVRMEPPIKTSTVQKLRSIHQALLETDSSPEDPDEVLAEIEAWARENGRLIREIDQQLARRFSGDITLNELEGVLQTAIGGDELEQSSLATKTVQDQAQQFAIARSLFRGESRETWQRFQEVGDILRRYYSREPLAAKFQRIEERDELPDPTRLEAMVAEAEELRSDHLTRIYRGITGAVPPSGEPSEIPKALTEWLGDHGDQIFDLLKSAQNELPTQFPTVHNLVTTVQDGGALDEGDLTDQPLKQEIQNLIHARELIEQRDGTSLWAQLQETHRELEATHPQESITSRIDNVLNSATLPEPETVQTLLERAKDPGDGPEITGADALWQEIEALDPGTIVLIDPKEK